MAAKTVKIKKTAGPNGPAVSHHGSKERRTTAATASDTRLLWLGDRCGSNERSLLCLRRCCEMFADDLPEFFVIRGKTL